MSEAPVQHPFTTSNHPREIIDVDEVIETTLGAQAGPSRGPARPLRPPPSQVIILSDSDDEIQEVPRPQQGDYVQTHNRNSSQPRPRRIRRDRTPAAQPGMRSFTRIFSPSPPPPHIHPIPPVPPIPAEFNFVRHRSRAAPDYTGVFMPMDRPHPIEALLEPPPPPVQARPIPQNFEIPPPRGQFRRANNMGLGGAFLSLNRRNEWEQAPRLLEHGYEGGDWSFPGWTATLNNGINTIRRIFGTHNTDPDVGEALQLLDEEARNNNNMQNFRFNGQIPEHIRPMLERYTARQAQEKEQADYKLFFTHPVKAEHGFSNDFAPQEASSTTYESASSSSSSNEGGSVVLACAGCLEPLVMNVTGSDDVVRATKLWALRCGHILDGRCIDQIMKPPPPAPPPLEVDSPSSSIAAEPNDFNGYFVGANEAISFNLNGKRVAEGLDEMQAPIVQNDRKGKGRAYPAIPLPSTTIPATNAVEAASSSGTVEAPTDSMRSRLRPRIAAVPTHDHNHDHLSRQQMAGDIHPPEPVQPRPVQENRPPAPTRGRGRGRGGRGRSTGKGKGSKKGKAKPKPVIIEAEHIWRCPVASCQKEHKSHLIEGQWRMAEDEGAIAMFV